MFAFAALVTAEAPKCGGTKSILGMVVLLNPGKDHDKSMVARQQVYLSNADIEDLKWRLYHSWEQE